ncbi:DUF5107 domain-containing protein [Jiangella alkaliphila]|uniref:DUF5107 domain-containing protein n=1 Tax=Jiangella alkaliphila TaxID=419479 RepID=A0A1H2FZH0_9ACTN|nr:DUF5107 domain-containing protein [Jiangella alkaliphila]SDU12713.1 hypothetical protein SAMN04488563_0205 [Jiangella alkaliphila]
MIAAAGPHRLRSLPIGLVLLLVLAALIPLTSSRPAGADEGLAIEGVVATDDKTIEIDFDRALDEGLRQYVEANANAVRAFIHVDGGTAGGPDAALDGADLQTLGAEVFAVDTPEQDTLRIVLPATTTLAADGSYQLWLDGAGSSFDDLRIRAADGSALAGASTARFAFAGSPAAATLASVASVEPVTSRLVRVTFAQPILAGMAAHAYTTNPSRITVGGVAATYVQKVAGSDSRVYDLYLGADLAAGQQHALQLLGNPTGTAANGALRTSAGRVDPAAPVGGAVTFTGAAVPHANGLAGVEVSDDRRQLTVTFDHKLAELAQLPTWRPNGIGDRPVVESPRTGTTGDSLSVAELSTVLDLSGVVADAGADPSGTPGVAADLAGSLRHTAAYFADRRTIVVSLAEGSVFGRGSSGAVTLLAGSVTDVAGVTNAAAETLEFTAPAGDLPERGADYEPRDRDYLTVDEDASTTFTHYDYTFTPGTPTPDYRVDQANVSDRVVEEEVDAIVVENKYIKATFTPDYGARLLSLIYKPTGNDLLYANPVGTPYGHGANSPFYANWLMVWGGVAPTFSEAEHGKYWFLPWDYEIVETDDSVSIVMTKTDTINHRQDGRFRYGATGMEISATYTVFKDKPVVDLDVSLHNPGAVAKEYEYWTLTTLGPGRPLHEGSPTVEHLTPLEQVRRDSSYTWMADVERRVNPDAPPNSEAGRELYFDNMRYLSRWLGGNGIAYGLDLPENPQGDWWGAVNHENEEGVIRVSENDITTGMKFWTWGFNSSFDTNPYSKGNSGRPYVEPWGGVTDRFFLPDVLGPGETKSWTETFMPIQDLYSVTNANEHGAAVVDFGEDGTVSGHVFPTDLGRDAVFRASLVDAASGEVLVRELFRSDEYESAKLEADAGSATTVQLVLERVSGGRQTLLTAEESR